MIVSFPISLIVVRAVQVTVTKVGAIAIQTGVAILEGTTGVSIMRGFDHDVLDAVVARFSALT